MLLSYPVVSLLLKTSFVFQFTKKKLSDSAFYSIKAEENNEIEVTKKYVVLLTEFKRLLN